MKRLVRDPFFWGSLFFIAAFQAFDFYILEASYYDSGAFFGLSSLSLVLVAVWLVWNICLHRHGQHQMGQARMAWVRSLAVALLVAQFGRAKSESRDQAAFFFGRTSFR
jgi:hypothetical protein